MIRRPALVAATAFLAALTVSSCATITDNANAARVGDVELSRDALAEMVTAADATGASADGELDAEVARGLITQWVRVVVLETENGVPAEEAASIDNLDSRLSDALDTLAQGNGEGGRTLYEAGPAESGLVCLAVIPVATADDTAAVLAALEGGTSFADAAAEFSADEGLAANGGVITTEAGDECFPLDQLAPELIEPIVANEVGSPFAVSLPGLEAAMVVRPYDELGAESRTQLALAANSTTVLPEIVGRADVAVDSRYGYWDSAQAQVLAFGA